MFFIKKGNKYISLITAGLLFLFLFSWGMKIAQDKPLWNDEIYSLTSSIQGQTYKEILLGKTSEGNIAPLFYILQKGLCDLTAYQVPVSWLKGASGWGYRDFYAEYLLRINPVLFMALSCAIIFFYFFRYYSLAAGIFSIFIFFSSYMVWIYWAEARHYSLWLFLTTAQLLIYLRLIEEKNNVGLKTKYWEGLIAVHFLLSVTIIFSMVQVFAVSVLLFFYVEKNWKKYIIIMFIPMAIAGIYYILSPKYHFFFTLTPEQLIRGCFSRDRFYIMFIFIFFLSMFAIQEKIKFSKRIIKREILSGIPYLLLTVLMIVSACFILIKFKLGDAHDQTGFPITNRYFIYLTPVGIIGATLFIERIVQSLRYNLWVGIPIFGGMGYLVVHRFIKVLPDMKFLF